MNTFTSEKLNTLEELNTKLLNKNLEQNNNIIFVYCPPKVGSTTLVSSIRLSAAKKFSVVHLHDETLFWAILDNKNTANVSVRDLILYNKLLGKNVYVIDIFRSPIERKISEFFEQISTIHFNNSEKNINLYSIDRVINRFNNLFPHLGNSDYYKEVYDLQNIPDTFNFVNKYLLQEKDGIKYIKLRLKDSESWGSILSIILETPIIIVNDYETDKKPISDLFKKFKSSYKIPENFLVSIKNSPLLAYYYSESERNEYFNLWESKKTNAFKSYTKEEYIFYQHLCLENQHQTSMRSEHYIDIGCLCIACSIKRAELLAKAVKGEKVKEKIIHYDAINQIKTIVDKKNQIIQERVNKVNALINVNNIKKGKNSAKISTFIKNHMKNVVNK